MKRLVVPILGIALGLAVGFWAGVYSQQRTRGYRSCVLNNLDPRMNETVAKLIERTCLGMYPPKPAP